VNEWLRHQEQLRGGYARVPAKPVVDMRAHRPEPVAADNEQLHTHINRPADLSVITLAAAITKVLSGAVGPVIIGPATAASDGIGGTDDV